MDGARNYLRNGLALRKRTNNKKYSGEEALEKLRRFCAGIQKRCKDTFVEGMGWDPFYGRYPRALRNSLDQVPFNFDMGRDTTIEEIGANRVQIHTGRDTDCKRMGTLQIMCYCLPKELWRLQPRIGIIFPGLGGKYYDKERTQYHPRVIVMFQRKAWCDRKTARKFVQLIRPDVQKIRKAVKAKPTELGLAFRDNLEAQTHEDYVKDELEYLLNEDRFGPAGYTPEWQIVDAQLGKLTKDTTAEELDLLQEGMSEEDRAKMTASERRIMITKAVGVAWEKVCETFDFEATFDRLGATIGVTGPPKDVTIRFQCMKKMADEDGSPVKFTFTLDNAPQAEAEDNGAVDHTGQEENANFPEELDESNEHLDRITPDEEEELYDDDTRAAIEEDASAVLASDDAADDLDIPSSEDEAPDEELLPYPEELRSEFPSVPTIASGSMVDMVKVGSLVAIFYIDEVKWSVGTVKDVDVDGNSHVVFPGSRTKWPYLFEDDTYGETKLWVLVNKAESEIGLTLKSKGKRKARTSGAPAGAAAAASAKETSANKSTSSGKDDESSNSTGRPSKRLRSVSGDDEGRNQTKLASRNSSADSIDDGAASLGGTSSTEPNDVRAGIAAGSSKQSGGVEKRGAASDSDPRLGKKPRTRQDRCAYDNCRMDDPCDGLVKCNSDVCPQSAHLHHFCFIEAYPALSEDISRRLCPQCASNL
eukprot:m.421460 g.421460  ORF g.421460 m.421460 type:complete len:704 (-) comp16848_c0_seq2:162-2273(-)